LTSWSKAGTSVLGSGCEDVANVYMQDRTAAGDKTNYHYRISLMYAP
jgi:hypothetical protein